MFDDLEEISLQFLDHDGRWWPFAFLRPARHERFGARTIAPLSLMYGGLLGLGLDILLSLAEQPLPLGHPLVVPLVLSALLAVALSFPLAWSWNRRAARAERRRSWGVASRTSSPSLPTEDAERDPEA